MGEPKRGRCPVCDRAIPLDQLTLAQLLERDPILAATLRRILDEKPESKIDVYAFTNRI